MSLAKDDTSIQTKPAGRVPLLPKSTARRRPRGGTTAEQNAAKRLKRKGPRKDAVAEEKPSSSDPVPQQRLPPFQAAQTSQLSTTVLKPLDAASLVGTVSKPSSLKWYAVAEDDLLASYYAAGSQSVACYVDEEWIGKHFEEIRQTGFLFHKDLSTHAGVLILALGLDPLITIDISHANYRYQIFRIVMKICNHQYQPTRVELMLLKAGIARNLQQTHAWLLEFAVALKESSVDQWPAKLTQAQGKKFVALGHKVRKAFKNGDYDSQMLDKNSLSTAISLLFPDMSAKEGVEDAWRPLPISRNPLDNAPATMVLTTSNADFLAVLNEFTTHQMNFDGIISAIEDPEFMGNTITHEDYEHGEAVSATEMANEMDKMAIDIGNPWRLIQDMGEVALREAKSKSESVEQASWGEQSMQLAFHTTTSRIEAAIAIMPPLNSPLASKGE